MFCITDKVRDFRNSAPEISKVKDGDNMNLKVIKNKTMSNMSFLCTETKRKYILICIDISQNMAKCTYLAYCTRLC